MSRRKREDDGVSLNLNPLMDMMLVLIPFLIMSASFIHLALVDVTMPAIASDAEIAGNNNAQESVPKVFLTINADGLILQIVPTEDNAPARRLTIRSVGGKHDYVRLTDELERVKGEFPNENTIVLVPSAETEYETVVRVMDATREKIVKDEHGIILKRKKLFTKPLIGGGDYAGN